MKVIGITGGVGSGKTAAAHMLADIARAGLLIADELGHVAMEKDTKGYQQIVDEFGADVLNVRGEIDRQALSKIVFGDSIKLKRLNHIIHPVVKEYIGQYIADRRDEDGFLILENAIMFETGCDIFCDEIWYIAVSEEIRKERLQQNRGYSREKSEAIMRQQLQDEIYRKRCQRMISNDGGMDELKVSLQQAFKSSCF